MVHSCTYIYSTQRMLDRQTDRQTTNEHMHTHVHTIWYFLLEPTGSHSFGCSPCVRLIFNKNSRDVNGIWIHLQKEEMWYNIG